MRRRWLSNCCRVKSSSFLSTLRRLSHGQRWRTLSSPCNVICYQVDGGSDADESTITATARELNVDTQVLIVGAGPAGLLLGRMLQHHGIDTVIVERRSRDHILGRIRAGVLEQGTVDTLRHYGVSERLDRIALKQEVVQICWEGQRHAIAMVDETGRRLTTYGQQLIVEDLVMLREQDGLPLVFDAEVVDVSDVTSAPKVTYRVGDVMKTMTAQFVVGCDGFRGPVRHVIPGAEQATFIKEYPFSWFGIMAEAPLANQARGFVHHRNGLAVAAARSATVSRLYLQVPRNFDIGSMSDDEVWDELQVRFRDQDGVTIERGPITQRSVVGLRAFVCESMRYGRVLLAGDAAHVVPPSGAKGLNLAVGDVRVAAAALRRSLLEHDDGLLDQYSEICLRRVWPTVHWSCQVSEAFHIFPNQSEFDTRRQYLTLSWWSETEEGQANFRKAMLGRPYEV
jgi:p-hydroxybenzoate 3-monooxygenase